ncbi:mitochondrial carrier domain-containing protein [Kickxella alabastrina]|uniref:mitochondrial carrier domain-containing protein n=1 Tax=Kickxella alabastrina TaxID=61397 RepID=UPI002220B1CC|nr:mitochondrial carrier domain-containing protein [Kickxella alabastrina]KAI7828433.1 mitochondrial carrier domain-containing protein [Kickxella alabastrina]
MNIGPPLQANDINNGSNNSKEIEAASQQLTRKQAGAVGATTSAVRGILLQPLYLWYRTPLKLFRPLRVDYLATARALLPQEVLSRRVSLRGSTLGMIANAVKQRGWSFLPRYVIQPMLANWIVGFTLFTTYTATLPAAYARASRQYSISSSEPLPWHPPFIAGAIAGLAQSVVATPLDSLRIRFEVEDMVNGRYHSWWGFVKNQLSDAGWKGLYRGLKLTMAKDVAGYAGFFGLFELIKNETIDLYRDLVQVACTADIIKSNADISRLTRARVAELRGLLDREPERIEGQGWIIRNHIVVLPVLLLPPVLGKPACILFAGAIAAVAYQAVDYPLEQFRALLYSEVASGEVMQQTVARRFPYNNTGSNVIEKALPNTRPQGRILAQVTPYRAAWKSLVDTAVREYPHPVQSGIYKTILAMRYLYRGWLGVSLRSIPAASAGLVIYEMLKSSL